MQTRPHMAAGLLWSLAVFSLIVRPGYSSAADSAAAGKLATKSGSLILRAAPGDPWRPVKEGQAVPAGQLMLGLPGASVDSVNGSVRLTFYLDLDEISPLPTIESAAVLNTAANADMDLSLQRGRVDLTNLSEKPAHVQVRYHGQMWGIELQEPGSRVALELCGRWAPGTRFSPKDKTAKEPHTTVIAMAIKGLVTLKDGKNTHMLKAPPGNALVQWDSVTGWDEQCCAVEKLPAWANPEAATSAVAKAKLEYMAKFQEKLLTTDVKEILTEMLHSDDPQIRRLGARACGALDELLLLGDELYSGKFPDLWDQTVVVLRHWLGREPGQDKRLYDALVELRKIPPVQAVSIINLLHSFGEADLAQPETYETLIEYLKSKTLPIRGLANWHLRRLVPAGRAIAYNPAGTAEEQERAYEAWKKLVPTGQLPSRSSPRGGEKQ